MTGHRPIPTGRTEYLDQPRWWDYAAWAVLILGAAAIVVCAVAALVVRGT